MSFIKNRKLKAEQNQSEFFENTVREQARLSIDELFMKLNTSENGLTSEAAEKNLDEFGRNIITAGSKNTVFHRLREALINPFNIILLVIAVVT